MVSNVNRSANGDTLPLLWQASSVNRLPHCNIEGDYSCKSPRLTYSLGGRYMRVRFAPSQAREWNDELFYQRPGRGVCRGFSQASRRTMLNRLNMVSVGASLPQFVTLTFPDDSFNDSVSAFASWAKAHLDTWLKRLRRVAPEAAGFWRMEWQARKSGKHLDKLFPHFHLMIWNLPERKVSDDRQGKPVMECYVMSEDQQLDFVETCEWVRREHVFESKRAASVFLDRKFRQEFVRPDSKLPEQRWMSFYDWACVSWYHVVDSHNTDHFLAGVSAEKVRSWGGVMSYCSKYMAKLGDNNFLEGIALGRSWGVFNRVFVPWAKLVELPVPDEIGVRIRRIFRRYLERVRGRRLAVPYGLTFYGDTSQWSKLWVCPPDTPF